jgi:uncharacterized protein
MMPTREAGWSTIILFLVVQPILILLLLACRVEVLIPIAEATRWLVHPDLIAGGVLLLAVVGGIVIWHGGLRARDVGLVRSHLPLALVITAASCLITQIVLVIAALLVPGTLTLHQQWTDPGTVVTLGFLTAMLLGMALYEEVAIRGVLFPQLYLQLGGTGHARLWAAAVLSAAIFALLHIPTRVMIGRAAGAALLPHLAVLTLAGLIGVVLYVRTENLLVVTGVHALVNAPTQQVAAPISPFVVTAVLSGKLWIAWPGLARAAPASSRRPSQRQGAQVD